MRRVPPLAVVLGALALFGAGIGILVAVESGGEAAPGPVAGNASTIAPRAGKLPRSFFGISTEDAFAKPGGYRAATLNRQVKLGIGLVRQTFDWAQIERAPGRYDFTAYDAFVGSLAARHMTVLPVLLNPPPFLSSAPANGAQPGTYPPRRGEDMAAFATAVARRYGRGGSFWRQHPELPYIPMRAYQIWNEPSLPAYWPSGPDPAAYTRMLAAAFTALKRVDRHADVVTAGIPESRLGIPFDRFLEGMYAAGAAHYFNTLAIHPYARDAEGVAAAVENARRIMDLHGDRRSLIWVTELGWADRGPRSSFTVGPDGQARRIESALSQLVSIRTQAGIRGVVYFGWKDGAPYAPTFRDFWGLHTGLLDLQGRPKPALAAFSKTVATLRRQG